MKKVFAILLVVIISLFAFNIGRVYAEETNQTPVVEEVKADTVEEPQEEAKEEPVVQKAPETPSSNETVNDKPVNENVTNETKADDVVVTDETNTTIVEETPVVEANETVEEPKVETETNETVEGNTTIDDSNETNTTVTEEDDIHAGEEYDIQKAKIIITKVDEDGNPLSGVVLQIIDSKGNIIEWTTNENNNPYEVELPDGTYTLQEVSAPDGYELADKQTIVVKVEIVEISAGADFSKLPCSHYGDGTPMYYVKIKGVKHEVYCINQNLETPDNISIYDGEILTEDSIKDFTKQTNIVGIDSENVSQGILSTGPIDVSDPSLDAGALYNKILDIIYHRHKAAADLAKQGYEYSEEEIRYITEVALKNYTNPGLAEVQRNTPATAELIATFDANGVVYKRYRKEKDFEEDTNGALVSYLKHNYRDYEYVEDAADNESIVRMVYGTGTSFGQMVASHWAVKHGADTSGTATALAARADVARYYVLFQYLIRDEDKHPEDMHLYIYSSNSVPGEISSNDHETNGKYQNLLGVTGYYEDIKQQEIEVEVVNKYSNETTEKTVKKIWNDADDKEGFRPNEIKVTLMVDEDEIETVVLNESNDWSYTWTKLPKYNKGSEIEYYIKEFKVKGYTTEIDGFTITNTHETKSRDIKVEKHWDDKDNYNNKRPKNVYIELYADNELIDTVELNDTVGWSYTWTNLDYYRNGKEINYTVEEQEIDGYDINIEGTMDTVFIVTNSYYGEGGDDNPKTGDNLYTYMLVLLVSLLGLFNYTRVYIKNENL